MSWPGPQSRPERIDLNQADDPRDVVHRTVACLAQGEPVLWAVEDVVGVAASGLHPPSVARARGAAPDPGAAGPLTLLLKGGAEVSDWVPGLSAVGSRLSRRAWPGPVTLSFPSPLARTLLRRLPPETRALFSGSGRVAFRVPAAPFVRDVLRLLPGPVVLQPLGPGGATGAGVPLHIEGGAGALAGGATVVEVDPDGWAVARPGEVDAASLTRMAGLIILFVCTGNTCRSPMAEALCKVLLAERLGCPVEAVESRGFVVLSAGIAAVSGMPAAANAIDVVGSRGGALHEHASRQLTNELVRHADLIVAMTGDHIDALLAHIPEAAPRTRLLHPHGDDVADPVGADRETYLRTARAIESYLGPLLDSLGL